VLDVPSLIAELVRQVGEWCYQVKPDDLQFYDQNNGSHLLKCSEQGIEFEVKRVFLSAGKGNADLLANLGRNRPGIQLRPLRLVVVKGKLPSLFAHCLGVGATPRVTITSCPMLQGGMAWYLGGQLAEAGINLSSQQLISEAQRELAGLLPWVDLSEVEWSTLRINRAEPKTTGGARPDGCFLHSKTGVFTAWPTKLAFAPRLAQEVLQQLEQEGICAEPGSLASLEKLPRPGIAAAPWEKSET